MFYFQLSSGYLKFDEIDNFQSVEQLNQFLNQDSEAAGALKTKLLELAVKSLKNDGDAYVTAIKIEEF
ncbi:hypothetical protein [Laspinema palackyanum]|uniref:hypothetical protein n=1 Tax=Laspinema palackyanum TaxID=3231601 RepID=UPI00345CD7E4|nr:hypothetical protein [Laspinema sp. D2c]